MTYVSRVDVTPETHPGHHTVGKYFVGNNNNVSEEYLTSVYYCESHDQCGYWLVNVDYPDDRINVSERAINRTYHEIYQFEDGGVDYSSWGVVKNLKLNPKARERYGQ